MIISKKKGLLYSNVLILLISIITLIIIIFLVTGSFSGVKKATRINECSQIFLNSNEDIALFGNNYNKPTEIFRKYIESKCIFENVIYKNKKDIKKVHQLFNDCWQQGGKGYNFLNNLNGNICLLCGEINVNNQNLKTEYFNEINNYKNEISFNDIEGTNINKVSIFEPMNFPNSKKIYVFYYIEQQYQQTLTNQIQGTLNQYKIGQYFTKTYNLLLGKQNDKYVAGILLGNLNNNKLEILNNGKSIHCNYIYIPKNTYKT